MARHDVLSVEHAAFAAWPAAETAALGDWRLRFTHGVSRRANSAWTPGDAGEPLETALERVEAFYRSRRASPLFQLSAASPSGLDSALADRGYSIEAPVSIQVQSSSSLASGTAVPPGVAIRSAPECFEAWFELSANHGRYRDAAAIYRGILTRVGTRARYFLAEVEGTPAAVALLVLEPPWGGIFSMLTVPEQRRRGLGRALLGEISRVATSRGAEHLYLQVERDNAAALALYDGAGFRELHGCHYRRAPG